MPAEPVRGHVDLLLLATLANGPGHGYAIVEGLRQNSAGAFDLAEGTVYPSLYRLEDAGLVTSSWHVVDGRRRRVYRLTRRGWGALEERKHAWYAFADAMRTALA